MAYPRKARDVWEIQGNCGYGWDIECREDSFADAITQASCYRANVDYPIRVVKRKGGAYESI